ncbi:hypothetical protein MPTK1_3g01870 [Marchantia polymorpha subsp. ruderalis]|uniref:Uncharacterized protein n=2 Tax=Marchantia polymorpha TaxID=3197 RepID=A0AAF6AWG1_MARPO|nr:hypothetical protein MARPO_0007s0177 [Marchantia polymorpha]BBN04095.1 hypothetical protein Mp_3g01870 [Marchantia polymorpha subsp. ruderalis]|eukprot:PTQ47781.1 hypothetical protein MARPO_0007s0177 [Marchantia polymorpha]
MEGEHEQFGDGGGGRGGSARGRESEDGGNPGMANGRGVPSSKKLKLDPDRSPVAISSAEASEDPGVDRTIDTAFSSLEAVKELEVEAILCMSKHKENQRRSDEARSRVLQAGNAVSRAEEAARIAKKAQRKAEHSFRIAEELARVSKIAADEAQARYTELQTQWEKDLETNLSRVLVQKSTVAYAYRDLQETAASLSSIPIRDMLDNSCVTQLETLVKRVNACWLRLTTERKKFTETISNVKATPQLIMEGACSLSTTTM